MNVQLLFSAFLRANSPVGGAMFSPVSHANVGIYRAYPKPAIDSYHASCEKIVGEVREVGCFAWINFSRNFQKKRTQPASSLSRARAVSL